MVGAQLGEGGRGVGGEEDTQAEEGGRGEGGAQVERLGVGDGTVE